MDLMPVTTSIRPMKTSGGLCPTRALHVKHKNLKKSIKVKEKS
jgi:hypothetical protein